MKITPVCFTILSLFWFFQKQAAWPVEIINPLTPISPPKMAPIPQLDYSPPRPNRIFPQNPLHLQALPFKLDAEPDIIHQQWCNSQYRSYKSFENSYHDHGGVRQQCQSPSPG